MQIRPRLFFDDGEPGGEVVFGARISKALADRLAEVMKRKKGKKMIKPVTIEDLGRILHNTFRDHHLTLGRVVPSWEEEFPHMLAGSVAAAFRIVHYHGRLTPEKDFLLWRDYALTTGWRYGENFSAENKVSPRLVRAFRELSREDKDLSALLLDVGNQYADRVSQTYGVNQGLMN